jgi:hypothetical protein
MFVENTDCVGEPLADKEWNRMLIAFFRISDSTFSRDVKDSPDNSDGYRREVRCAVANPL